MAIKDLRAKIKKWMDSCPVKDEDPDETEEQKAARLAEKDKEESKDAVELADMEVKDRKFKDEEEEADWEEFKKKKAEDRASKDDRVTMMKPMDAEGDPKDAEKPKEEEKPSVDKKACDDEGGVDLASRIGRLEKLIEALLATEQQEQEEEVVSLDKKSGDDDEEEEKKEDEEQKATADCDAQWPEIIHRAEILFPGMNVRKPTKDHASALRAIKIGALKGASIRNETAKAVETFTKGKDITAFTNDALDAVFLGASELLASLNNSKVQLKKIVQTKDIRTAADAVHEMNARNRAHYQNR